MACKWMTVFVLAVFVLYVKGQVDCPVCRDKYDHTSCDGVQECGVGWNYCELHVNTGDFYSLDYQCQEHTNCTNHEIYGCHPTAGETCSYCCEDVVTCQLQRDDLFNYVFPTAKPPQSTPRPTFPSPTTTADPSVTIDPTAPGSFLCPRCIDPHDYKTCTATQECDAAGYDICQLEVYTAERNRLEYSCFKYAHCTNHDVFGCSRQPFEVCTYCCLDPASCQNQREDIFNFVFPPDPVTLAPKPPAEPAE